jgi:hypothetical protein
MDFREENMAQLRNEVELAKPWCVNVEGSMASLEAYKQLSLLGE